MSGNYLFSLTPTFTQGLVLGQLSILVLLMLILKYLFLDSTKYPFETTSYHPGAERHTRRGGHTPLDLGELDGVDGKAPIQFHTSFSCYVRDLISWHSCEMSDEFEWCSHFALSFCREP